MATRDSKTYFEQIPVEVVKSKIMDREISRMEETEADNVIVERPTAKTEPYSVSLDLLAKNSI